jgi:hypothetical protein
MIRTLLAVLAFLPVAAMAQPPAKEESPPPAKPPERPATDRPALNLRLDNPSSWATTAPAEKEPVKGLPTLGGDARRIEPAPGIAGGRSENPTFPKDTAPGR